MKPYRNTLSLEKRDVKVQDLPIPRCFVALRPGQIRYAIPRHYVNFVYIDTDKIPISAIPAFSPPLNLSVLTMARWNSAFSFFQETGPANDVITPASVIRAA